MATVFEKEIQIKNREFWKCFSQEKAFVFLDSSDTHSIHAERSICAFNPFLEVYSDCQGVHLRWRDGRYDCVFENPFDVLDRLVAQYKVDDASCFFPGGAIGYVGYEAARHLSDFRFLNGAQGVPELWFGFYDVVIVEEVASGCVRVQGAHFVSDSTAFFDSVCNTLDDVDLQQSTPNFKVLDHVVHSLEAQFINAVSRIQEFIAKGHVYQINYSYRHDVSFEGDLGVLYDRLRQNSPAPFSALIRTEHCSILSSSPERFLKINERTILTSPIKGTRPRLKDGLDAQRQQELLDSEKDSAELLMIVDLERNDLNRLCEVGSVVVPCLKRLEEFEHVMHLVADVQGILRQSISHVDAFRALFPGGSITGAPKIRAVELIDQLEVQPRQVYTGCIGYFSFSGSTEFNIAIRSLYAKDSSLFFHTGCGIVSDSDGGLEWKESQAKAKGILLALGLKEDF